MRKSVSLILALILAAGCAFSMFGCSETTAEENTPAEQTPTSDDGAAAEAEAETEWVDPFAGTDFGGQAFRVSSSIDENDATNADYLIRGSEELNGESVNDAVFNRNQKIAELLNIKFEFTETSFSVGSAEGDVKQLVVAGDDAYDVVVNDIRAMANLSRDGYIHNIYNAPFIDFEQKYWYTEAMKDCQFIEGGMYLLIGDYFTDALQSCHCLYQNKDILNNVYQDPNYVTNIVFDGKWTYDAMISVIQDTHQDLNGDGQMKQGEDRFGFTCWGRWGSMIPFLIATDIQFIERTDDGPQFCFNNERSVEILEKMIQLFNHTDGSHYDLADASVATLQTLFANGLTTLVGYNRLGDLSKFREVEFQMSALPYPKLNDQQENYVTSMHDTSEIGVLLMTLPVSEMPYVCTVLEVCGRETNRTVI
ncbi:MAG: hypothetical protein IIU08_00190, partial [Clostridia bacterium]|nr:hypothetical protein [Clostridia bacterium]